MDGVSGCENTGGITFEDRTDRHVFAIDPMGCKDADDAMGEIDWVEEKRVLGTVITTYITHVPHTLSRLGAWPNFNPSSPFRVATTYLPDHNLPMLPRSLSEGECSLSEGSVRPCLAMDQYVTTDGVVMRVEFVECMVRISKNYTYESPEMCADPVYRVIHDMVVRTNSGPGPKLLETVENSHDVVEWLMVRMNCVAGERLYATGQGIFRSVVVGGGVGDGDVPSHITGNARKFMCQYRNTTASYELAKNDSGHGLVVDGADSSSVAHYAQITSPIRRFVDLINMVVLCDVIRRNDIEPVSTTAFSHALPFLAQPFLAHLNQQMRGIKRVQNDVALVAFGLENEGVVVEGVVVDCNESSLDGDHHVSIFVDNIGGGKSFSVPIPSDMVVGVGDTVRLKVVSLPSKSTAYQKTRLSVVL
jgi:hypothetical protein